MKKFFKSIPVLIFRIMIVIAIILLICAYFKLVDIEKRAVYLSSYVSSENISKVVFTDDDKTEDNLFVAYIFDDEESIKKFASILNSTVIRHETKNLQTEMLGWWKKYIFIYYEDGTFRKLTFFGAGDKACSLDTGKDIVLNFHKTQTFSSFVEESNAKPVLIDNNLNYIRDFTIEKVTLETYFGEDYKKPWCGN